jgi:hypothetical protein
VGLAESVKPGQVHVRIANLPERPPQLLALFFPAFEGTLDGWFRGLLPQPEFQRHRDAQREGA